MQLKFHAEMEIRHSIEHLIDVTSVFYDVQQSLFVMWDIPDGQRQWYIGF